MGQRAATIITKSMIVLLVVVSLLCVGFIGYARSQGQIILSVQTGSMRPTIHSGDAVLVRQGIGRPEVGDIISYRSLENPALIITHRIVTIDTDRGQIFTQGDMLETIDPPFGADRIVGTVVGTIPFIGYGIDLMRRPLGLVVAVYMPAGILVYSELRRLTWHYARRHYRLYAYPW